MTLPPAWLLSCSGILFLAAFATWKLAVTPRLERRLPASSS